MPKRKVEGGVFAPRKFIAAPLTSELDALVGSKPNPATKVAEGGIVLACGLGQGWL